MFVWSTLLIVYPRKNFSVGKVSGNISQLSCCAEFSLKLYFLGTHVDRVIRPLGPIVQPLTGQPDAFDFRLVFRRQKRGTESCTRVCLAAS